MSILQSSCPVETPNQAMQPTAGRCAAMMTDEGSLSSAAAELCLVRSMRRAWVRVIGSLLSAVLLVVALFAAWLILPSPFSDTAGKLISWPPAATFTWIPHERGMGPGPVWIFGPALPNIVVATLLFYFAFSVWSRRRSRGKPLEFMKQIVDIAKARSRQR